MTQADFRPYSEFTRFHPDQMLSRAQAMAAHMATRRTVREFSSEPVDPAVIDCCLRVALSAPSGANQQPWTFVVVNDRAVRRQLREAAEVEEREFYNGRAPDEWLNAVAPFGTDASKPFLETAPVVICVFAETWKSLPDGSRGKNYYVAESVGIATGFLIAALHHAGLATLTHTPSPMKFLNSILARPENERPFLILVAGFPAEDCQVPVITKRRMNEAVIQV
ncbi:MAG: nitroreductase family protein [Fuerstia sp.]|nr:nitroreductase family protein [Fuerstiella sp.]